MNEHVKQKRCIPMKDAQFNLSRTIISFLILWLLSFHVSATEVAAQSVNVKLTLNNTTVAQVVEELHQQTGYGFSYDAGILSEKLSNVSIDVVNEEIENVLSRIFSKSDISFKVINN